MGISTGGNAVEGFDLDGIGAHRVVDPSGADDCDDDDPARSPGNEEIPYDGIDNDCDDATPDDDLDGDGFVNADDCDDTDADLGAQVDDADCDGVDFRYDCDDTDPGSTYFPVDADCDGSLAGDDCDDTEPEVFPGMPEVTYNLWDDDCDPSTPDNDLDEDGVLTLDPLDSGMFAQTRTRTAPAPRRVLRGQRLGRCSPRTHGAVCGPTKPTAWDLVRSCGTLRRTPW